MTQPPLPIFATVTEWRRLSGMGRTNTFLAIRDGKLHAVKSGARTLIDVERGVQYMRSLPPAGPAAKAAAAAQ